MTKRIAFVLLLLLGVGIASNALAGQAVLAWDANIEPDLAGYKVHYGTTSGNYTTTIDVGNVTTFTVTGLTEGETYYFAATAYDTWLPVANESGYSNEVPYTVPPITTTTFALATTTGTGGTISPPGVTPVNQGNSITINNSPDPGYELASWSDNGSPIPLGTTYTISNFSANHTISAAFRRIQYTITATAGSGGTISGNGLVVNQGDTITINNSPDPGYELASWSDNGSPIPLGTTYTISNFSANHTISAAFRQIQYAITATAGPGGTINPSGTTTYNSGSTPTFTPVPNSGYRVATLTVNGTPQANTSQYIFPPLSASSTINATFEPLPVSSARTILFQSTAGQLAFWSLDASQNRIPALDKTVTLNNTPVTLYSGWNAKDHHQNADGTTNILIQHKTTGQMVFWTLDANKNWLPALDKMVTLNNTPVTLYSGWEARVWRQNADGTGNIFFQHTQTAQMAIWTIDANKRWLPTLDKMVSLNNTPITLYSGWEARSWRQKPDGTGNILFQNSSTGQVVLWTLDANKNWLPALDKDYGITPGFKAKSYNRNADGTGVILLQSSAGEVVIWNIDATKNHIAGLDISYGPTPGWNPLSLN